MSVFDLDPIDPQDYLDALEGPQRDLVDRFNHLEYDFNFMFGNTLVKEMLLPRGLAFAILRKDEFVADGLLGLLRDEAKRSGWSSFIVMDYHDGDVEVQAYGG